MMSDKRIIIDPRAGFCGGVKRAILLVQDSLKNGGEIFVRGELIHNQREMERLARNGLRITPEVDTVSGKAMFIRTHGETPDIYRKAEELGLEVIDATCRNVKKSQEVIADAAADGRKIYIFGKRHHPEVIGLCGYCRDQGRVIQSVDDFNDEIDNCPSLLIPQTTADPGKFEKVRHYLAENISDLVVYNAICPFVSHREDELRTFAASVDAIVFVGGKQSSNTAILFSVCKSVNHNSFFADRPQELPLAELSRFNTIGVSGSASTPMWQLEEIANYISDSIA